MQDMRKRRKQVRLQEGEGSQQGESQQEGSAQGQEGREPVRKEVTGEIVMLGADAAELQRGGAKDGVLASTIAPRNRAGRPTQTQIEAMQAAITNACPPARVEELINEAIEYARFHKSPKAIVSILELVFDRTIGAVVPAQPEQPDGLELVLTRLRATWTQSHKVE